MSQIIFKFILIFFILTTTTQAQTLTISNHELKIEFNSSDGIVSLFAKKSNYLFVTSYNFQQFPHAQIKKINDPIFGDGEKIVFSDNNNETAQIAIFQTLPFALFQTILANNNSDKKIINTLNTTQFTIKSSKSAKLLKSFGTGGLLAPNQNPGSYAWLSIVDPQTKSGVVAGWLTHDRASGILFSNIKNEEVILQSRSDYGRLIIQPKNSVESEILAIGWFDDARIGLEKWADAVATHYQIKLHDLPTGYCTWYADKHGGSSDEDSIVTLAQIATKNLLPYGFQFLQIDDGWQQGDSKGNGPNKNFTNYRIDGPYSHGMKATAQTLLSYGFTTGIWFMPFAGTYNDPWFASHQNWFVKREDGSPYDTDWGGTSLDMSHPEAQEYVRTIVARLSQEWGYRYFKMDGLYTGLAVQQVYVNSGYKEDGLGDAYFYNSQKTNIEIYRDGLKLIRSTAGPDVFFLGCTTTQNMRSYAASFGLVDAMRIGPDNDGTWKGWVQASPVYGSRHYFLHNRIWYNDPDPNYVRAVFTLDEARTMAGWTALAGQLNTNSDWIPDLSIERMEIIKRTIPSHQAIARPVDLFENDPPRIWLVQDSKSGSNRNVIGIFNWSDKPMEFDIPIVQFGLDNTKNYIAYDFWKNQMFPISKQTIHTSLNPHASQILSVHPLLDRPFLLSTNRHVTQGIIDVESEQWDEKTLTLSGVSQVVGNDPYELRIVIPDTLKWHLKNVRLSTKDEHAGEVTIVSNTQENGLQRIRIHSHFSRSVEWSLIFAKQ